MTDAQGYKARQERLLHHLHGAGVPVAVLSTPANLFYFSGVWLETGERAVALILHEGKDPVFIVHEMFSAETDGVAMNRRFWRDGDDVYQQIANEIVSKNGISAHSTTAVAAGIGAGGVRFAVDGGLEARHLLPILGKNTNLSVPVLVDSFVSRLRAAKGQDEIAELDVASQMADDVVQRVKEALVPGVTERDVAERLAQLWKEVGAPSMSFPPIVAFGKNGGSPHHEPGLSKLSKGDMVIVDTGGVYNHYCSDITRTYLVGSATSEMQQVYEVCLEANLAGIAAAKPGVTLGAVDKAVRDVITKAGYGPHFTHRTGHGVGIEIHEPPFVSPGNDMVLEPGMVMSIEPGIYLPDKFGVRIEDLIVMEEARARPLNKAPKSFADIVL